MRGHETVNPQNLFKQKGRACMMPILLGRLLNPGAALEPALQLHRRNWSAHVDQRSTPDWLRAAKPQLGILSHDSTTSGHQVSTKAGRHLVQKASKPCCVASFAPKYLSSFISLTAVTPAGPILRAIAACEPV